MIRQLSVCIVILLTFTQVTLAADSLITTKSSHSVTATAEKLIAVLESKGMTVFEHVNHTAGAEKVGLTLRPTQVVIFGNPKIGTPLMNCSQSIAIDLPQKMLIWEDENSVVWLGYNDPEYLKIRHATEGCDKVFATVAGALEKFAGAAAAP